MQNGVGVGETAGYRAAMLEGANLIWEERWDAATTALRRALSARPADPFAERQLRLALSRRSAGSRPADPDPEASSGAERARVHPPLTTAHAVDPGTTRAIGRTASTHIAELATLPRHLVPRIVEGMREIEREQAQGKLAGAFDSAFTLLQQAPDFLPLHILIAELYMDSGQWDAVREKLDAVEAAYAARSPDRVRAAA